MQQQLCRYCKKPLPESGSSRPFCSARCKDLDFGAWVRGEYRIPDRSPMAEHSEENSEPESDQ